MMKCNLECLFPQDEESLEWARKWKAGELGKSEVSHPNELLPEFWETDEIIYSTTIEPTQGDIVALDRGWRDCHVAIYDESIQELIDLEKERLLGVVVETRHDPIVQNTWKREDLKYRKVGQYTGHLQDLTEN